jgi:ribonuclease VapC
MFVDTSVVVAILSGEDDARDLAGQLQSAPIRITSVLVVLEAAMRLSTKLAVEPTEVETTIEDFLREAEIEVSPIDAHDGQAAVLAFAQYGKGRGHPAQLNLADCLSYACAKNRKLPLLFKGNDFSRTDIAHAPEYDHS